MLPEVRAEVSDEKQAESVRSFVKCADVEPSSVEDRGSHISFSPASTKPLAESMIISRLLSTNETVEAVIGAPLAGVKVIRWPSGSATSDAPRCTIIVPSLTLWIVHV